jgi:hypothetical protein
MKHPSKSKHFTTILCFVKSVLVFVMVMYQGALLAVFFAVLLFPFFGPLTQRLAVLGVTRDIDSIINIHGEGFRVIPDTVQCEDLHLHEASGMLFTACQGSEDPTARLGQCYKSAMVISKC